MSFWFVPVARWSIRLCALSGRQLHEHERTIVVHPLPARLLHIGQRIAHLRTVRPRLFRVVERSRYENTGITPTERVC
jgi:hypothetical protein